MKNIIIYGPTAVGKSDIAVILAKKIDAEIISADSMQIYEDLNIGSAKVTTEEMQGVKHHLIDIKKCTENYSVFEFVEDCKAAIKKIKDKGKNVIIVGGTGLYIKALTENYNYADVEKDLLLREQLNSLSNEQLVERLKSFGVEVKNDDINNRHRLIRYNEIQSSNGVVKKEEFNDDYVIFVLNDDRQRIYERINKRVDIMIEKGLIEETKYLLSKADENCQSLKAIGYKELIPYIKGEESLENCVNLLKQKSRNYAKRQITFMNQFKNKEVVLVTTKEDTANEIYNMITKIN